MTITSGAAGALRMCGRVEVWMLLAECAPCAGDEACHDEWLRSHNVAKS